MLCIVRPVSLNGVLSAEFTKLEGACPSTTVCLLPNPLVKALARSSASPLLPRKALNAVSVWRRHEMAKLFQAVHLGGVYDSIKQYAA